MRLHKTGHAIADTISRLIGDVPDGNYNIVYGILRHSLRREGKKLCILDRGFWGAHHFDGNYRLSFSGTQPRYDERYPLSPTHGIELKPWRIGGSYTLICPPTEAVCDFFKIDINQWMHNNVPENGSKIIRHKGADTPVNWDVISSVITFNSTIGFEALRLGIPVISDPDHSTIGSFCKSENTACGYDRNKLFSFSEAHQFKLSEKGKICQIINYYMSL